MKDQRHARDRPRGDDYPRYNGRKTEYRSKTAFCQQKIQGIEKYADLHSLKVSGRKEGDSESNPKPGGFINQ